MAQKQPRWSDPSRARQTAPGAAFRVGGADGGALEALHLRLARCLVPAELESAILSELAARLPGATALISARATDSAPVWKIDARGIAPWPSGAKVPRMIATPITDQGEALCWIAYVDDAAIGTRQPLALAHLMDLAAAAALPARNARRHGEALELALHDPVTGVYNRRAFDAFYEHEAQVFRRERRPLSVMLADLDYLKTINDHGGHAAGDLALRTLAGAVAATVRASDIVARWGGDEFAVLLPGALAPAAARIAGRIRRTLATQRLSEPRSGAALPVTASFGIADTELAGGDLDQLLRLADEALYSAKHAGRNRVACAPAPSTTHTAAHAPPPRRSAGQN